MLLEPASLASNLASGWSRYCYSRGGLKLNVVLHSTLS